MRRPILLLPSCLAALAIAGCGNKGPLYLPARPAPATTAPAPAGTVAPAASASATAPAHAGSAAMPAGGH
jgi:diaminopimelate decarboxylase